MVYLILSVVCSVLLGFIFKLYPKYGVNTLQAIVVNYFVCVICGGLVEGNMPIRPEHFDLDWMPFALLLGFVFITGFNGAALTVQYFGVTISQIMQKMSILLSVPFAILAYNESSSNMKIVGFVFALLAIVLVNFPEKKEGEAPVSRGWLLLSIPIITWFLSGIIEVVFVHVNHQKMIEFGDTAFISTVFGAAGVLGTIFLLVRVLMGKTKLNWISVLGGIVLGVPNYGSMYFILQALSSGMEGSFFYPINNLGIILVTAFGGYLIFKEKYSKINFIGLACAVLAIVLMGM